MVYVLQAATPLRLDDDAVDYLRIAASLADSRPLPPAPVPIGYPVLVASLDRAGVASSFAFVLANCLFLALGLFSASKLLSDKSTGARWAAMFFTLLAIPTVKSVAIALPEATFFGLSLAALWAMSSGRESVRHRAWLLAAACFLTALATSVRLVGLALLPALIWSFAAPSTTIEGKPGAQRSRIIPLLFIALLAGCLLLAVARTSTFAVYDVWTREYYGQGGFVQQLVRRAATMLRGWGEIVLNVPFSRFKQSGAVFTAAGVASACMLLMILKWPRRLTPSRVYVLTYVIILAVWPRPSPRLWMPIMPLIAGEVASALWRLRQPRWADAMIVSYCAWFALTGLAALAYSSRVTFAGKNFATVYGNKSGTAKPDPLDPNSMFSHGVIYNEEAKKLRARYGRQ